MITGYLGIVDLLIKERAELEHTNDKGSTSLHIAAQKGFYFFHFKIYFKKFTHF